MNAPVNSSADLSIEIMKMRQDLDTLVILYKKLAEKMIPSEDLAPDEEKALRKKDRLFSRAEIDKALQ